MGGFTELVSIQKILSPKQKLVAVSKFQPIEKIQALYEQGQKHFGENYIQEALEKIDFFTAQNTTQDIQWHFIGHLQKNKVKFLQKNFAYIHSVDSVELAEKISEASTKIEHTQKIFVQVNLADEDSKGGLSEAELATALAKMNSLKGIQVVGLMTMPPLENDPESNRIYFKKLSRLASQFKLTELSMGTSQDYKVALEEGATWVRLGTILFGERPKK